jgi:hypothetical protein
MTAEKLRDRWLKSKVELAPDEAVLDRGYFWYRAKWWQWAQGRLYLTSKRLVWIRAPLNLPLGPRLIELALGEIRGCEKRRPAPWSWGKALFLETADGHQYWFSPLQWVEDNDAWNEAISSAVEAAQS